MTVNKVILVGNLGQRPELRTTGSGLSVSSLRIATSDRRKGQDGQWTDLTEWHTVVVFGNQAENCAKFLDKGRQVYVEGRLQTRKWQDKEGKDRWSTEVVANTVKFLNSRGGAEAGGGRPAPQSRSGGGGYPADDFGVSGNDEIPF